MAFFYSLKHEQLIKDTKCGALIFSKWSSLKLASHAFPVDIQIDFLHFIMVVPDSLFTLSAKPTAGSFSDVQESGIKLTENASLIAVILLKYTPIPTK